MAIRDKEGNVVRLRHPNPVMSTQEAWDGSKIVFHNMYFPTTTMPDRRRREDDYEPLPPPIEEEVEVTPLRIPQSDNTPAPQPAPRKDKIDRLIEERTIRMLCLPVLIDQFEDSLYGSTYSKTRFGQKTVIKGVVIRADDLQFVFWTESTLESKSIVYPTQTEMKRWWRVEQTEPQSRGYLVSCSPSPISPDFSD